MKHLSFTIIFLLAFFQLSAQFNPEAVEIIKPVSESILNSSGVSADFVFTLENKQKELSETDSGKLVLQGNKYHLSVMGTETYFDGTTQWVHMVDEEEVNISNPDPDDKMELTPVNLFTLYEQGFRFRIVQEKGNEVTIDMFPDDKEMPYYKISLVIDKAAKLFKAVEAYGRDGVDTKVEIKNMQKGLNLNESEFVFNSAQHPDVEVIDMR
ncbi:outer membrane lipoprotein carrier protein LolA [Saccharicrinis sp. FJH2]|uniref:LolA family protein n=1 Tax=Saccharicrinis sp. FJH65 TaxID=3344659 RepID=UPI0035F22A69